MLMRKIVLYILFGFMLSVPSLAERINVPYADGLEAADVSEKWTLNALTQDASDKWVIGEATYSEGRHSLYISQESEGRQAQFGYSPNVTMAYTTLTFPETPSGKVLKYNISFDWKCMGDGVVEKLYVYVGPEDALTSMLYQDKNGEWHGLNESLSSSSGLFTNANVLAKMSKLYDGQNQYDYLSGSKKWQNYSIYGTADDPDASVSVNHKNSSLPFVLCFLWVNQNKDTNAVDMGACIDNIQISSARVRKPWNVSADINCEDSTVVLTYNSTLTWHDIEYKNINDSVWKRVTNIPANDTEMLQTYSLSLKSEGFYNIRIRGANNSRQDTSAYSYAPNITFWCPQNHCINYIDLDAAECRYGNDARTYPQCDQYGVMNFGEEARESQHTVNWIEDRYDPLTINSYKPDGTRIRGLTTIPEGAMASVRLGNWENGDGRESITYSFVVDSVDQAIVILKYAVLLEDPGDNHSPNVQPGFDLEILDAQDRYVHPRCGVVNFIFDDASEWNRAPESNWGSDGGRGVLFWKDWTSLGLNLAQYHGELIKVRLTTHDCGQGGHAGYAYFTLDCINARLSTDNCGAQQVVEIQAPDGFDYEWRDSKGNIIGNEARVNAPAGHDVYTCRVCMREVDGCCFNLSTTVDPRYPFPSYTMHRKPADCRNYIQFENTSHVVHYLEEGARHTDIPCDQIVWSFYDMDGTLRSSTPEDKVRLEAAPEGDSLIVHLYAAIGGGVCDTLLCDTLAIPSIYTPDSVIYASICEGENYIFAKQSFNQTGTYTDVQKNIAGCDSTAILQLTVWPKSPETDLGHIAVCSSDLPFVVNDYSFINDGNYKLDFKNAHACDSVIRFSLEVIEKLQLTMGDIPNLCADDGTLLLDFSVLSGNYDSIAVSFVGIPPRQSFRDTVIHDKSLSQLVFPYDATMIPDHYHMQVTFFQPSVCGNQTFDYMFDLRYRSSIVEQKWNNVLTLLSPAYNGGYEFTAFQWYKNGQPMDGETHSYLYQPLEMGAEYQVLLTRSDGVSVFTCPIMPEVHEQITPFPTIVQPSQQIAVRKSEKKMSQASIFTSIGQLYATYPMEDGEGTLIAPSSTGHYVVRFIYEDGSTDGQHLIVM